LQIISPNASVRNQMSKTTINREKGRCLLISDFNLSNFAGYLRNDGDFPLVDTQEMSFTQCLSALNQKDSKDWKEETDFAVLWTQPQSVIASFNRLLHGETVAIEKILQEVKEYVSLLSSVRDHAKIVFIPTWVIPSYDRGFGLTDMREGVGITNTLMRMNLKMAEVLEGTPNHYILNTQKWIELAGERAFSSKLWYMAKIPFGNEVFIEACRDIKAALRGIHGASKKLIILDLDDTLWGGIVGEVGVENIRLGGHDPEGEAYLDFQRSLKTFANRGILLGIVSKNEEAVALDAIRKHAEMVLKPDDFAGWKINWGDKAQNIVDLVSKLNLGLESVVFIDDNPAERERVREALPEVYVPEWPEDKMLYRRTLLRLSCFENPVISQEDRTRQKKYISEHKREALKKDVPSLNQWLMGLKIRVKVEELSEANLQRTVQLLNKTNQMNLTTRRMTELELLDWVRPEGRKLWAFRVSDKFGDSGLTGITSLDSKDGKGQIVDFVLSCRVMGRKIEQAMVAMVIRYARSAGLSEISATYIPTPKNKPCLEFWGASGFKEKNHCFIWEAKSEYLFPKSIEMVGISHDKQKSA